MKYNIKSERVRAGLTQEEVASKIGVHVNTVRLWEWGESQPGPNNLLSLSSLFGCSPDYLLGLTEERVTRAKQI